MKTKSIKTSLLTVAFCGLAGWAATASAFELEFDDPNWSGFIDTTVTASVAMATKSAPLQARTPSGRANIFSESGDVYSAPLSFITDLGIRRGNWGLFTRFGYAYDFAVMDNANKCTNCGGGPVNDRTPAGTLNGIPDGARNEYNAFTLYDLFVYGDLELSGHLASLRIGRQVVNWGESSIMGGGISSVINPSDLVKLTTPGTEVKETLLPQEMVYFNYGVSEYTSIEAYYVWQWRRSQFIPVGTFFSPFDFLGQGFNPDLSVPGVEKRGTDKPKNGGQWGLAMHHVFEGMNDMDMGIYWTRSHAQQPYLQANFDPSGPGTLGFGTTYHEVFSEDQDTYAISFAGEVGNTGMQFQTEVNMRENFWDTRECQNLFGLAGILGTIGAAPFPASWTPNYPDTGGIPGCENENNDVYTWLGSLLLSGGGGLFGADSHTYLFDWQLQWTEDQSRGDATDKVSISGPSSPIAHGAERSPGVDQLDRLVSDFSWGYVALVSYTYNDVFANINVSPRIVWVHNVEGYEPFNTGALVENQRTVAASVTFDYQNNMSLQLGATWWPGKPGTWSDRDNVSAIFKYSF